MPKMRPLGIVQNTVLANLKDYGGSWHPGSGWVWTTPRKTASIFDTLVSRKLVTRRSVKDNTASYSPAVKYTITLAGIEAAIEFQMKEREKYLKRQSPVDS